MVADKGYHSNDVLRDLKTLEMSFHISEPGRGRRNWCGKQLEQHAVYGNQRRMRGERAERSFAHLYETGRMRRTHLRGHENILKRLLLHGGAFNLSLLLSKQLGAGTPRGLAAAEKAFNSLWETVRRPFSARRTLWLRLWKPLGNGSFRPASKVSVLRPARAA